MKFASATLAALGFLMMVGCKPISGTLSLSEEITISNESDRATCTPEDNRPSCIGPIEDSLRAGEYSASVDFVSKTQVQIKVQTTRFTSKNVTLNIPAGKNIPNYTGPISLSSRESGQPFNIGGRIETHESDSQTYRESESCTYTRSERVCDRRGRCDYRTVTYTGRQQVEYHFHYTNVLLNLNIVKLTDNSVIGKFDGRRDETDKVYTYQGPCY